MQHTTWKSDTGANNSTMQPSRQNNLQFITTIIIIMIC